MKESESALDTLIEAAILAPSGDNTQPWRFVVDEVEPKIRIYVDPDRDPSPMNAGQRMSRIAVGAALENVLQTANANELQIRSSVQEDHVEIQLHGLDGAIDGLSIEIAGHLRERATNRRLYHEGPVGEEILARLRSESVDIDGTNACWIVDPKLTRAICEFIGRGDALLLSAPGPRKAFLDKVRFDQPSNSFVREGLSLGSLELSLPQQLAMRTMPYVPNWLLKVTGGGSVFRSAAMRLAGSAPGFCIVMADSKSPRSDYSVGRVFQRSWLSATTESLACQPMMSLLVLQNILDNGSEAQKRSLNVPGATKLLSEFEDFIRSVAEGIPRALLRFGKANAPSVRTGRLPSDQSVESVKNPVATAKG